MTQKIDLLPIGDKVEVSLTAMKPKQSQTASVFARKVPERILQSKSQTDSALTNALKQFKS